MAVAWNSAANGASNATTLPTATLSTTAANDILIAIIVNGGAVTVPNLVGTYTGTWGTVDSGTWTTGAAATYWSRCTGNHTGQTIAGTTVDSGQISVSRITGAGTIGSPIDGLAAGTMALVNGTVTSGPTTSVHGDLLCMAVACDDNAAWSSQTHQGVGIDERADVTSSGGADSWVGLATTTGTVAGATGSWGWTQANPGTMQGKRYAIFGIKPPVTVYDDAATGSILVSGSGVETYLPAPTVYNDTASGIVAASGSAVDSRAYGDATTGNVLVSGSGSESHAAVDSQSGSISIAGSGSESSAGTDAQSGTVVISGSGDASRSCDDSTVGILALTGSGVEDFVPPIPEGPVTTGEGRVELSSLDAPEAGTQTLKIRARAASGSGILRTTLYDSDGATPRGTDDFTLTGAFQTFTLEPSGIADYSALQVGFEGRNELGDPLTAEVSWIEFRIPQASGAIIFNDSASGLFTLTGASEQTFSVDDATSGQVAITGTGVETYVPPAPVYDDSATGLLILTGQALESATSADSQAGTVAITGTSTESHVFSDSASGIVLLSGTATESGEFSSSASGTIAITGSAVESHTVLGIYEDAETGTVAVTGQGQDSQSRTTTASGTVALTGTGVASRSYSDSATGTIALTGSGVDAYGKAFYDAATGTVGITGSGVEESTRTTASTGFFVFTGTGVESWSGIFDDSATGTIKLLGTSVDTHWSGIIPETELNLGGSIDETLTGGYVTAIITGGIVVEHTLAGSHDETATGGAAEEPSLGGDFDEGETSGEPDEGKRGGEFDEALTGGVIA